MCTYGCQVVIMALEKNKTERVKEKRVIEAGVITKGFADKLTFDKCECYSELSHVSLVDA